ADVPMLPSIAPAPVVARKIVAYSYAMVATSLLVWPITPTGWFYPAAAAVLGGAFLAEAHLLAHRSGRSNELSTLKPMRLFHGSNAYLALLFVAAAVDPFLR